MTRELVKNKIISSKSFDWLSQMRFYFDPKNPEPLQQLSIHMANARFNYGFEYLGVQDKLVQTPLTDRCYLTMTQALEARLGGSPFGQCQVLGCNVFSYRKSSFGQNILKLLKLK
jgi:dynein heavy chain 1